MKTFHIHNLFNWILQHMSLKQRVWAVYQLPVTVWMCIVTVNLSCGSVFYTDIFNVLVMLGINQEASMYMCVCLTSLSTGPNWTPLEVPSHLQETPMLHVVLLVPSLGRGTHCCCWWEVVAVSVMVYLKTCGCWMWTEEPSVEWG